MLVSPLNSYYLSFLEQGMSKASRLQNEATTASAATAAESRDFDRISIRLVIYGPVYMRLTQPGPVAPLIKRKPSNREWHDPMSMPFPTYPSAEGRLS